MRSDTSCQHSRGPLPAPVRLAKWLLVWTFGGSGLLLLGTALWLTQSQLQVLQSWEPVSAVVLHSTRNGPSVRFNTYSVTVQYTRDGRRRTAEESRSQVAYAPHAAVTAYLNPARPWVARIHSPGGFWLVPGLLLVVGGILTGGAWALLRRPRGN